MTEIFFVSVLSTKVVHKIVPKVKNKIYFIVLQVVRIDKRGFPSLGGGFDSRIPLTFPISVSFLIDKRLNGQIYS